MCSECHLLYHCFLRKHCDSTGAVEDALFTFSSKCFVSKSCGFRPFCRFAHWTILYNIGFNKRNVSFSNCNSVWVSKHLSMHCVFYHHDGNRHRPPPRTSIAFEVQSCCNAASYHLGSNCNLDNLGYLIMYKAVD